MSLGWRIWIHSKVTMWLAATNKIGLIKTQVSILVLIWGRSMRRSRGYYNQTNPFPHPKMMQTQQFHTQIKIRILKFNNSLRLVRYHLAWNCRKTRKWLRSRRKRIMTQLVNLWIHLESRVERCKILSRTTILSSARRSWTLQKSKNNSLKSPA